jgi:hypothetical protein
MRAAQCCSPAAKTTTKASTQLLQPTTTHAGTHRNWVAPMHNKAAHAYARQLGARARRIEFHAEYAVVHQAASHGISQ